MSEKPKTENEKEEAQMLELFYLIKRLSGGKEWRFCKHQETRDGKITIFLKFTKENLTKGR